MRSRVRVRVGVGVGLQLRVRVGVRGKGEPEGKGECAGGDGSGESRVGLRFSVDRCADIDVESGLGTILNTSGAQKFDPNVYC